MEKKGQVFSGELLIAYVIFTMVLIMVVYLWSNVVEDILESEDIYDLESTAMDMSEKLMKTPGVPVDWNRSNVDDIGLANTSRNLEEDKVTDFLYLMDADAYNNSCNDAAVSNYECNKHMTGAGVYDFYLDMRYLNGSQVSLNGQPCTAGRQPVDDTRKITVTRTGLLSMTIVQVRISVWR
jgi:hypothetical protein